MWHRELPVVNHISIRCEEMLLTTSMRQGSRVTEEEEVEQEEEELQSRGFSIQSGVRLEGKWEGGGKDPNGTIS